MGGARGGRGDGRARRASTSRSPPTGWPWPTCSTPSTRPARFGCPVCRCCPLPARSAGSRPADPVPDQGPVRRGSAGGAFLTRARRERPGGADRAAPGPKPVRYPVTARRDLRLPPPSRGRSSMVEPQPSKLVMRVRFPSPAPLLQPRSGAVSSLPAPVGRGDRERRVPHTCHTGARLMRLAPPVPPCQAAPSRGRAPRGQRCRAPWRWSGHCFSHDAPSSRWYSAISTSSGPKSGSALRHEVR